MAAGISLIVGLGNPGAEYEKTRHNAGAWFVQALADEARVQLRHENKYQGFHATTKLYGQDCHLLIPSTFMNLSGQSVQAVANYYKIPPQEILVAHDEVDLAVGDIRLKFDGGHGGHNGLKDIIRHLGSNQFHRLRIGVGRPAISSEVVNYVLAPPKKSERGLIDTALQEVYNVMPLIMSGQMQKAMQELHTNKNSEA